ncbi:uncharacterized protein C1orf198 homolog [Branchiostoma floridae]|uniref:Uncharacterized protein C1orf198 homolog n=1 Tax=Branchiostoma floridae TaxID=7739 RepID=C3XR32_BRAFL|nr:uncharacterized protein C1orf198 homolog [Branchiostoma floridae]|eukprot:XP_002613141.1 hypothetical protein BRAFLDRAFT_120240 [Branchiostoma floridae]
MAVEVVRDKGGKGERRHRRHVEATLEDQVDSYFRSINPMARRIVDEVHKVKHRHRKEWDNLSAKEQDDVINDWFVPPEVKAFYKDHPKYPDHDLPPYYPRLILPAGEKIVHDPDDGSNSKSSGVTWLDEHSGPFHWETKSQQELHLPKAIDSQEAGASPAVDKKGRPLKVGQKDSPRRGRPDKRKDSRDDKENSLFGGMWEGTPHLLRVTAEAHSPAVPKRDLLELDFEQEKLTPSQVKAKEKAKREAERQRLAGTETAPSNGKGKVLGAEAFPSNGRGRLLGAEAAPPSTNGKGSRPNTPHSKGRSSDSPRSFTESPGSLSPADERMNLQDELSALLARQKEKAEASPPAKPSPPPTTKDEVDLTPLGEFTPLLTFSTTETESQDEEETSIKKTGFDFLDNW